MLSYFAYIWLHFSICFLIFVCIQRPLFIAYNHKANPSRPLKVSDLVSVYVHGYKTDLIAASYLTALPLIVVMVRTFVPFFTLFWPLVVVELVTALILALVTVSDTALYKFWQFKIDSSVLVYLRSLKGAFASVSAAYIIVAFASLVAMVALLWLVLMQAVRWSGVDSVASGYVYDWSAYLLAFVGYVVSLGIFVCFVRGIHSRPNNPSMAYYCKNVFYNHAALNPLYNFIYSFTVKDDYSGKFKYIDDAEASARAREMFPVAGSPSVNLLRTKRPNIVFIIWESLCANYIEPLGGKADVTPNFNRIAREGGVLFTNVSSGSFRTDRGIVCLLSGIPGQPTSSIIRQTRKLPSLPALPRTLKEVAGYNTTIVHGGDLSVLHKGDFYIAAGHDRIVSQPDFPKDAPACRWGVHDNYIFDWLYDDIMAKTPADEPWWITFQTLSSHQPFIVPYQRLDNKVSNAYAFSDDAFGRFVDRLKQTPQWDDLLIVVAGDHGLNDGDEHLSHNDYSHIPILLCGGAVAAPMEIDQIVAQTDLPAILLGQMGIDHTHFTYSRDVLADTYKYPFTLHSYKNGFVFRDHTGFTDFDLVAETAIENPDMAREKNGKIILQDLYSYLSKL